jgi:hypothetical protein
MLIPEKVAKVLIAPKGKPPALLGRLWKFYLYRGFPRY